MSSFKEESRRYFAMLGAHVCQLRKAHKMTQAELARALGVSQQAVFAYELGTRRISVFVLARLARVFGVSLNELTGIDPPARKTRVSPRAIRLAERLQALPTTQRRFVFRILNLLEDSNAGRRR